MFMKEHYVFNAILYAFFIQSLNNYFIQIWSTYEGWIDMTKIGWSEEGTRVGRSRPG